MQRTSANNVGFAFGALRRVPMRILRVTTITPSTSRRVGQQYAGFIRTRDRFTVFRGTVFELSGVNRSLLGLVSVKVVHRTGGGFIATG